MLVLPIDWLQVGSSFPEPPPPTRDERLRDADILTVYKKPKKISSHESKKKKKSKKHKKETRHSEGRGNGDSPRNSRRHRGSERGGDHDDDRRLAVAKSKRKHSKKRRRSSSGSDSSGSSGQYRDNERTSRRSRAETQITVAEAKDTGMPSRDDGYGGKLFEFDCAGDQENRFYGSLYDPPRYDLATRRDLRTGKWIVPRKRPVVGPASSSSLDKESDRYFGDAARKRERNARQKRLRLAYSEKRLGRQRNRDQNASELVFIPLPPLLDGEKQSIDSDLAEPSSSGEESLLMNTESENMEQYLVTRNKEFNIQLAANPSDTALWLDFMAFQEQSLRLSRGKSMAHAESLIREKQLAILDKAIQRNPNSRELQLVKLNLKLHATLSTDSASMSREIETLLAKDPTNDELWLRLVECQQQSFAGFSMPSIRELFARMIANLRKEATNSLVQNAKTQQDSRQGSILVFGKSSLLALPNVYGDDHVKLSAQAKALIESLIKFQFMLCILEAKAGYIERSITLMQALIEVNTTRSGSEEGTDHLQLLQHFSERWDQGRFRFGDDLQNPEDNSSLSGTEYVPSDSVFKDFVHQDCTSQLIKCNPPNEIRTKSHDNDLLMMSRAHLRASARENNGKGDLQFEDDNASESEADVRLEYSNLHGYRIQMDDIDDVGEYERILSELRGTESSLVRQETRKKKLEKKQAEINADIAGVRDERVDYEDVEFEDEFVQWHLNEDMQQQMQWKPLRPSVPSELQLLEDQPDRAALTDEIQPFIFRIPSVYRWTLVKQLLDIIGVALSAPGSLNEVSAAPKLYRDSLNHADPLLGPILDALDPTSQDKLFLSALQRRDLLQQCLISSVQVKKSTLYDPSKVVFVRNIFNACSRKEFLRRNKHLWRLVIKTWIEFETRVALEAPSNDLSQEKTRELCQRLLTLQQDETGAVDVDVMFSYAKMELQFGSLRQMNRVCDKTLASLQFGLKDAQGSRNFHQLIFLRARNLFWSPSSQSQSAVEVSSSEPIIPVDLTRLTSLHSLWSVWQSNVESLEQLQKQFKKKPHRLRDHLHQLLDPQTQSAVIERYRIELEFASQQCENNHAKPKSQLEDMDACHVGYCVHNLCLAVYASHGFDAACEEYEFYLDDRHAQTKCWHLQWTWFSYLEFMQQHQAAATFPILSPRKWRAVLGKAVSIYPTNHTILRLFADAETSNTVSQTLRQYFLRVKQIRHRQFDSPELVEWLFALLCELYRVQRSATKIVDDRGTSALDDKSNMCCLRHKWQMNQTAIRRIRRVFEDMISQIRTQGSALAWRLYVRFEVAMGKIEAARKVFYRALAKCPWSKALYMDGVAVLRPYLSSDECRELMEFMTAKEIHVRVDSLQE